MYNTVDRNTSHSNPKMSLNSMNIYYFSYTELKTSFKSIFCLFHLMSQDFCQLKKGTRGSFNVSLKQIFDFEFPDASLDTHNPVLVIIMAKIVIMAKVAIIAIMAIKTVLVIMFIVLWQNDNYGNFGHKDHNSLIWVDLSESVKVYSTVQYTVQCTVLYCTVLYVLYCTVLYVLYRTTASAQPTLNFCDKFCCSTDLFVILSCPVGERQTTRLLVLKTFKLWALVSLLVN